MNTTRFISCTNIQSRGNIKLAQLKNQPTLRPNSEPANGSVPQVKIGKQPPCISKKRRKMVAAWWLYSFLFFTFCDRLQIVATKWLPLAVHSWLYRSPVAGGKITAVWLGLTAFTLREIVEVLRIIVLNLQTDCQRVAIFVNKHNSRGLDSLDLLKHNYNS